MLLFRYFAEEEETPDNDVPYQPAPGSPGPTVNNDSDSEDDPLEAFMAGIEQQVNIFVIFLFVKIFSSVKCLGGNNLFLKNVLFIYKDKSSKCGYSFGETRSP